MSLRCQVIAFAAASLLCMRAFAADATPVGVWKTIDDKTGQPKSLVEISEQNGMLTGKVKEVLQSDQGPNPICKEFGPTKPARRCSAPQVCEPGIFHRGAAG